MGGTIPIIIGLFWIVVILVLYFLSPAESKALEIFYFAIPGVFVLIIGAAMEIIYRVRTKKYMQAVRNRQDKELEMDRYGISTRGRVSFVDKNYALLVDQTPVYSIVEYKFTDQRGIEHTGENIQVPSEVVIRNQVVVGSEIEVRYLSANPEDNRLVLPGIS